MGSTAPNATGVSFTFIHTTEKWAGENNLNKFYIQYGRGPAKTFTSGFETFTRMPGLSSGRTRRVRTASAWLTT